MLSGLCEACTGQLAPLGYVLRCGPVGPSKARLAVLRLHLPFTISLMRTSPLKPKDLIGRRGDVQDCSTRHMK